MSGWRGRDWTGLIKRTSEYKSLVADLKPGKLEEMTVLTNKVDEAISERMDDYNHLFSYWKELTKELDELSHEHSRREKEYKEKFYKPSRF
jgi:predicted nuclease with TOPRIM domain